MIKTGFKEQIIPIYIKGITMSNKANIKNQFNIPYNPINDNLDEIILLGYHQLTSTEKIIYLTTTCLARNGKKLTRSELIKLIPKCERTVYYSLKKLREEGLLKYHKNKILPLAPDYRNIHYLCSNKIIN